MRVFPLSNWTEMDVWEYIKSEKLEVPNIYFSHERECFRRGGQWLPVPPPHTDPTKPDPFAGGRPKPNEPVKKLVVRVRTIADMISTGMIESPRRHRGRHHRRSRRRARDRTRLPRRRQGQRSRDGRPQKSRIFLTTNETIKDLKL